MPLSRQASIVAAVLPPRLHFPFALSASRWHGRLVSMSGGNGPLTELLMRDLWLQELTSHGAFPILWRLHGRDVLDRYLPQGPVLYFTIHLAMSEIPLRVVTEIQYPVPIPVADPGRLVEGERYKVLGMNVFIPALAASSHSLARMRTLLLQGNSIACLADRDHLSGSFSANPLRLAGRLGVPVIFTWGELAPDGVIDVAFEPAPHPMCESEEAIEKNLRFLRELHGRILRSVGLDGPVAESSSQSPVAERVRLSTAASSRVAEKPVAD